MGKGRVFYYLPIIPSKICGGHAPLLLKGSGKVGRGVPVVLPYIRNASLPLYLHQPGTSLQLQPLNKLIQGLVSVLFEEPGKMIPGVGTVPCHIIHRNILIQMFKYEVYCFINNFVSNFHSCSPF